MDDQETKYQRWRSLMREKGIPEKEINKKIEIDKIITAMSGRKSSADESPFDAFFEVEKKVKVKKRNFDCDLRDIPYIGKLLHYIAWVFCAAFLVVFYLLPILLILCGIVYNVIHGEFLIALAVMGFGILLGLMVYVAYLRSNRR